VPSRQKTVRRALIGVLALLLVSSVVVGAVAWSQVTKSFPRLEGEAVLTGLDAPVTVVRNERGVADIYADDALDLFKAQGYVHAQDRFFEMDLRRHITAGRLSELVGPSGLDTDKVIRTLGWRQVAEKSLPMLSAPTRRYLQAYADGVNAYLRGKQANPSQVAVEYTILGQKVPDYRIEDWGPIDSLAWLQAMAWDLKGNYSDELTRARLAGSMSQAQIAQIFPVPSPDRSPIVAAQGSGAVASSAVPGAYRSGSATATPSLGGAEQRPDVQAAFASVQRALDAVPSLLGEGDGVGSNSWVVAGSRSMTGKPILANDPHLAVGIPGIWYQTGLHCRQVSAECPFDVSGFTFSGLPGVVIGHNARIAWGLTNLGPDVTDFYLERVQGETTLRDGSWVPLEVRTETISVPGQADRTITVRSTGHGPILSDVVPAVSALASTAPVPGSADTERDDYAVSLAWTGLEPSRVADAIMGFDTAKDFTEFRAAAELFSVPAQNLLYADVDGHIGYQAPGTIPVRATALAGAKPGAWPAPGWTSSYDWKGSVPFDQLPSVLDPAEGFIVAANQQVSREPLPFLTGDWDPGLRSQRIRDLIGAKPQLSPADMVAIQADTRATWAEPLVKALLTIDLKDPFAEEGQDLLRGWNLTNPADDDPAEEKDAAAAAYFNVVWDNLVRLTFDDELPAGLQSSGGSRWAAALISLLGQPKSGWWDDKLTPTLVEGRDEVLKQAMINARLELTERLGKDPNDWRWGDLHRLTLTHKVLGGSAVPGFVRALVNVGPLHLGGGGTEVNALGWDAAKGYDVNWGPSMRMVVDLSALDRSLWQNQTGQSGHPAHENYSDQVDDWVAVRLHPWPFGEQAVTASADNTLTLKPATTG
jgi:penicillin amidase